VVLELSLPVSAFQHLFWLALVHVPTLPPDELPLLDPPLEPEPLLDDELLPDPLLLPLLDPPELLDPLLLPLLDPPEPVLLLPPELSLLDPLELPLPPPPLSEPPAEWVPPSLAAVLLSCAESALLSLPPSPPDEPGSNGPRSSGPPLAQPPPQMARGMAMRAQPWRA
jgi:hypothetical protein